ncbi:MAG: response regulator [Nitrospirae bacterium]|nr:response regulator [Nitrospirota bacterium]
MSKIKILAMDDSPTVQKLLKMVLEEEGYDVICASDGIEGIDKAKKYRPSIILIDFVMPKMNGYQVCKIIKEDPDLKNIPIILVTSKGDEVGNKFVKMLGITEYLTKPFQPTDLISKISEVIDKNSNLRKIAAETQEIKSTHFPAADTSGNISISEIMEPLIKKPEKKEADTIAEPQNIVETIIKEVIDEVVSYVTEALPDMLREKILKLKIGNSDTNLSFNKGVLLYGDLSVFRFPDILQMISIQKLTGCLSLISEGNKVGIFFRNGWIVFVSYWEDINESLGDILVNAGKLSRIQLQHFLKEKSLLKDVLINKRLITVDELKDLVKGYTEESIYKLFSVIKGNFQFTNDLLPMDMNDMITELPTNDIILDGVRRIDEWQLINKKICNRDAVLKRLITDAEELGEITLSDKELEIFSFVDGKRNINQIIKESKMSEFDVCKTLYVLLSANLLTITSTPSNLLNKQPQYL